MRQIINFVVYFRLLEQAQMEARRKRIEIENTAPLVTDTQTNGPRAAVDKNCNATAFDQVQSGKYADSDIDKSYTRNGFQQLPHVDGRRRI